MIKRLLLLALVFFVFGGCAGMDENAKTRTHRYLEHAGIDWYNF